MADKSDAANCSKRVFVGSHLKQNNNVHQPLACSGRSSTATNLKLLAGSPIISVVVAMPSFSRFRSRSSASKNSLS
jgi:hypothetical protein